VPSRRGRGFGSGDRDLGHLVRTFADVLPKDALYERLVASVREVPEYSAEDEQHGEYL